MKLTALLAATAVAALASTSAYAQSAFDGSIALAYIHAPDDSYDYQSQIGGSLMYTLNPSIAFQLDLSAFKDEDNSYTDYSYGVHAIYSVNDAIDIGLGYARDTTDGDAYYSYTTLEAGYRTGAFDIETHVTQETQLNGTAIYYVLGAQAGYTFSGLGSMPGDIQVFAGFNNELDDELAMYTSNYYAGVNVDLWNGLQLNTRAATMEDGSFNYYTIGLTYNFGNGSRFSARDSASSHPGY